MKLLKLLKGCIVILLYICSCNICYSQKTEMAVNFESNFEKAKQLYNTKMYAGAQLLFKKVADGVNPNSNLKTDADYYDAMCAIKLNQTEAEQKVLNFVKNHPYSIKCERAFLTIGNHYFANRKASHALQWYTKVNEKKLNDSDRNELNYKMGYALLISNYYADAKAKFSTLLGSPKYGNDARYYYGYISYRQENFEEANENFSQLANDAAYTSKANYYLLDIAFKNGDFKKAIEIGEKIIDNHEKGQKSHIVKMIGESYFNIGEYDKAIPYLKQYKGEKGKWNNTDLYYVGYAYYKKKDYENAVKYFTKIIDGNNTIAQNAYYHLGECYLLLGKKGEALNAFKNAKDMSFNAKISADAHYNYAKLSYEEGNPYKSTPEVLQEYLIKHPESEKTEEIKDLLITSYLFEQDFEGALKYLTENYNSKNKKLVQEISLHRAIQLFNNKQYRKALPYFDTAIKSDEIKIRNKAFFWRGETNYLLEKYRLSLNDFLSFDSKTEIEELIDLDYNLGYTYFKIKKYEKAKEYFKSYIAIQHQNSSLTEDAIARLADCYYATKNYKKAIEHYNHIIKQGGTGADYAQYQKAMSLGLSGNNKTKIENLMLVNTYEESVLKDDALFQLATTHTAINEIDKANLYYNQLITEHPKSSYMPTVLLRQGLLAYNENNNKLALEKFKEVALKFSNSEEANQAISNARNVYIDLGNIEEYVEWANSLPNVNITNKEIDDSSFMAAENKFMNADYSTSILSFTSYLKKFPDGAHLLKANFYLAESYFSFDSKRKSIPYYEYVINQEKNEYSEDALSRLCEVYLELEKWDTAITLLHQLEKEANHQNNVLFAHSNLMKGYYHKKDYEKAKAFAFKVLSNSKLDQIVDEEAKIIIARSAAETEDFETAREYYTVVDLTATDEMKAETLYYKALFLHQDKLYEASNKEIQQLIAEYSNYKYWGVRSYIIMAKNYFALKDAYQAAYILESVIENFTEFQDLVEDAKNELRKVKNEEAKENESINTNKQ